MQFFRKQLDKYAKRLYEANLRSCAQVARSTARRFLNLLGLSPTYDLRRLVLNPAVSNRRLQKLSGGYGWPDWKVEAIEEKRSDALTISQWARAILEYRADRPYHVVWRFSFRKQKYFETVFDFYLWQLSFLPKKPKRKR